MIPTDEIMAAAKALKVPTSTIECDYAQGWLLANLPTVELALKGGTGVRKAYIPDYRFSDDLDFTVLRAVDIDKIRATLLAAVQSARDASLIPFETALDLRENKNGYVTEIYFGMLLSGRSRIKIKVDISKQTTEGHLLPLVQRPLIHPYSDRCEATLSAYSLEEMAAEKVRSLFQRTRARDLFDVHRLDWVGEIKFPYPTVEIQLAVERAFDVLGLAESVLFAFERHIRDRNSFAFDRLEHHLRLIRRNDLVFQSLE